MNDIAIGEVTAIEEHCATIQSQMGPVSIRYYGCFYLLPDYGPSANDPESISDERIIAPDIRIGDTVLAIVELIDDRQTSCKWSVISRPQARMRLVFGTLVSFGTSTGIARLVDDNHVRVVEVEVTERTLSRVIRGNSRFTLLPPAVGKARPCKVGKIVGLALHDTPEGPLVYRWAPKRGWRRPEATASSLFQEAIGKVIISPAGAALVVGCTVYDETAYLEIQKKVGATFERRVTRLAYSLQMGQVSDGKVILPDNHPPLTIVFKEAP